MELGRELRQGLSGPVEIPGKGSKEGEEARKSFWGDPFPVPGAPQRLAPRGQPQLPGAQHSRRKGTG